MRSRDRIWIVLAAICGLHGSVRAGVYNFAEKAFGPLQAEAPGAPLPFPQFKGELSDLVNLGFPLNTPLQKRYQEKRAELETKVRRGDATTDDRINLSAYAIYLRDPQAAIAALLPVTAQDRANFAPNANLMTAYQLSGQLDRAFAMLESLRETRPNIKGLNAQQIDWLVRAEKLHHKLITERYKESLRQTSGRPMAPENVDDLFGVRFVGESGQFEPSQLAASEKAKLPLDAIALIQQLLVWLPDDTRLYWQLGELYNAQGDLRRAAAVFDECRRESGRRLDAALLREHRQLVQEALAKAPPPDDAADGLMDGLAGSPGDDPSWAPDTLQLAIVGGLAAVLVLGLGYLQYREFRRRRGKPFGC
jgi:tetratricopeptide (TPR) repeat protein